MNAASPLTDAAPDTARVELVIGGITCAARAPARVSASDLAAVMR